MRIAAASAAAVPPRWPEIAPPRLRCSRACWRFGAGMPQDAPQLESRGAAWSIDIAVVPVAGLGTRLLPATKSQPKEMLPVGRKPVVQYVVEELTRVGMTRVLFVTGPGQGVDRKPLRSQRRADSDAARERQGGPARRARVRARDGPVLLHAPAAAARPRPRRLLRASRSSATSRSSSRSATRSSACTPKATSCSG